MNNFHNSENEDLVTHHGEPLKAGRVGSSSHSYMGTLEENVSSITAPITEAHNIESDSHSQVGSQRELTPG